ncbi:MAG TPA: DUF937 domain-containing protein [Gemmatimonadales bacterium]|nr:DUF937 domain-containing protein [Gemmatimonadales bacterium]
MLKGQIGGDALSQVSQRLGVNQSQIQQAIGAALPVLLAALARNAAKPEGATALHEALVNDHDGSVLNNLTGVVSRTDLTDGNAILGHVLGDRRSAVETGVSKLSGLGGQQVTQLLAVLAPVVMGALGKMQRQQNLDPSGLATALAGERQGLDKVLPNLGGLAGLLDADGDGQILDDVLGKVTGALGGLFGGRK